MQHDEGEGEASDLIANLADALREHDAEEFSMTKHVTVGNRLRLGAHA